MSFLVSEGSSKLDPIYFVLLKTAFDILVSKNFYILLFTFA